MKQRRNIPGRTSKKSPSAGKTPPLESKNLIRGRFRRPRLPEVENFSASLPFDRRLYRQDILGSIAHARMLAQVGLISPAESRKIVSGLKQIEREITADEFQFEIADEDIHLAIERRLIAKIGAAGAKLHTARSRNDQVALDFRLYLRDEIGTVIRALRQLRDSLLAVARDHVETVMPGYTHLQRAQPVTLAHHILAYVEMFDRDSERFAQARERVDVMPLGAGALAGTTLPIDRAAVARELGFRRIAQNSIDAVSDRDFAIDFLSAAAILAVHMSRMAEEIILWTSSEFAFADLPDEFSTGSSMMPQKKNPDLLELIRGKTGRIVGNLVAMLTVIKGLPLAYNSDLQEDKERVFDTLDTIKPTLDLMAKLWPQLKFNRDTMAKAAAGFALATDLAEYLVAHGVPFRESHEAVGAIVRDAVAAGRSLSDLSLQDFQRYSKRFGPDVFDLLTVQKSLAARKVVGGPAPATVKRRIDELAKR